MTEYTELNAFMLNAASDLIVNDARCIDEKTAHEFMNLFDMSEKEAVLELFAANLGFDFNEHPEQRNVFQRYFGIDFRIMGSDLLYEDNYLKRIRNQRLKMGRFQLEWMTFEPYELMFINDIQLDDSGIQRIVVGCFNTKVAYPMLFEKGMEWMSIVPSEINTMKPCIEQMHGKILVLGLGLGYFAFHVSRKENVESVMIVEISKDAIELFRTSLLPVFDHKEKIQLICDDAMHALEVLDLNEFDCVFADIWHNGLDGAEYVKQFEHTRKKYPHLIWINWLQNSIDSILSKDEENN